MNKTFKAVGGVLAIAITVVAAPHAHDNIRRTQVNAQQLMETRQTATVNTANKTIAATAAVATQEPKREETKPAPKPEPVQPKPAVWQVSSSPHGRVSVAQINEVLGILQAKGVTKQGAAYLTGNFIAESYLLPCAAERGDGGAAWGLGQWHPNRRHDMPCDLKAQIDWAIDVEMPRDHSRGGGHNMHGLLYDGNATADQLLYGFKLWERYGIEGNRAAYGHAIYAQL